MSKVYIPPVKKSIALLKIETRLKQLKENTFRKSNSWVRENLEGGCLNLDGSIRKNGRIPAEIKIDNAKSMSRRNARK